MGEHLGGRDGGAALQLVALVALWALGLLSHTVTLTAALPTLTHRRALTLSLTGSAVANVLPLGGAAGIALNYRMTRHWGFTTRSSRPTPWSPTSGTCWSSSPFPWPSSRPSRCSPTRPWPDPRPVVAGRRVLAAVAGVVAGGPLPPVGGRTGRAAGPTGSWARRCA